MDADFAGPINGVTYLVLVDSHSKWPEVMTMPSTSASATIIVLDKLFATHGLPETIVSDNGTQFTSPQFDEYCNSHAIEHIGFPLYHPQSNGQAEKFVDSLKRAWLKTKGEGGTEGSIRRFLITYEQASIQGSTESLLQKNGWEELSEQLTTECFLERRPVNQRSCSSELPSTSVTLFWAAISGMVKLGIPECSI